MHAGATLDTRREGKFACVQADGEKGINPANTGGYARFAGYEG